MDLRFFVIYTPNSFHLLQFAIKTLVQFSEFKYSLVGNGVSQEELDDIKQFCQQNPRLNWIDLPGNVVVPHGTALNHLFNTTDDEYFCFADSDVFATGAFTDELIPLVKAHDVFSSCKPIEWLVQDAVQGYRGHCTTSPSGKPVSMTYFSTYKRARVNTILKKYNISFERYMRREQVPAPVAQMLSDQDQHTWKFNTAKLLNIVQAYQGQSFAYQEFEHLIHLGGVSRYSENSKTHDSKAIMAKRPQARDRLLMRAFFYELLNHFSHDQITMPEIDLFNKDLEAAVLKTAKRLSSLYQMTRQP